eukprot:gene9222-9387_t
MADQTALDTAAAAHGFQDACDERAQFELMMSAVYAVLSDKLQVWHQGCVMRMLPYSAQLQIHSDKFMQQVSALSQQFPVGFLSSLEQAMVPLLPQLPNEMLLAVAAVFSSYQHRPDGQFLSGYALITADRMPELCVQDIKQLVQYCGSMGAIMPSLWHVAVRDQLQK